MKQTRQRFEYGENSFDLIRIFAALVVMLGHFGWKYQIATGNPLLFMKGLSALAHYLPGVPVFFAMGGFLIYGSIERSNSFIDFAKKRIARIYPGIWVCTIVYAVVLIVVYYKHLDFSFVKWIAVQFLGVAYTPGCLKAFATGSVNGSLWFIMVDIELYVVAGITYRIYKNWNKKQWAFAIIACVVSSVLCDYLDQNGIAEKLIERSFFPYMIWFGLGMFAYRFRDEIVPMLSKHAVKLLVSYTILYFEIELLGLPVPGYYSHIVTGIMLPLITIGMAYRLGKHRVKEDITYEIFLYHWLILNLLIYFGIINSMNATLVFSLFIISAVGLAWVMHQVNRYANKQLERIIR